MSNANPTNDQDHGGREIEPAARTDSGEPYRASHGSVADQSLWPAMHDEYVISLFFAMCAESGNPDLWDQLDAIMGHLCDVRQSLTPESVKRCKAAGFEYLTSLKRRG
jgi:hypothetical protein